MWTREDGALQAHAIDNGLTFPEGGPGRFLFAVPAQDFAASMVALDETSVAQLRSLRLESVARILQRHDGITKSQVRETLARIVALQKDPQQLARELRPGQRIAD